MDLSIMASTECEQQAFFSTNMSPKKEWQSDKRVTRTERQSEHGGTSTDGWAQSNDFFCTRCKANTLSSDWFTGCLSSMRVAEGDPYIRTAFHKGCAQHGGGGGGGVVVKGSTFLLFKFGNMFKFLRQIRRERSLLFAVDLSRVECSSVGNDEDYLVILRLGLVSVGTRMAG